MRILWHSNAPWTATGYGVQTRVFAPRIRDLGHDVAISAFYGLEGASIQWDGMTVYPRAFHPYGMDVLAPHATDHKADVVITLVDAWVIDHTQIEGTGAKWAPWYPVDHDPIPPRVSEAVAHAWQPLTYSRHGTESSVAAGLSPVYIPHGIETDVYTPTPQAEARKRLGLPSDAFIVGIVAANKGLPSRKALPTQFEAFARFHERHPNSLLYVHTHLGPEMDGIDVSATMRAVGIPEGAVRVCDQYRNVMGYSDRVMASLYSALDVLSSPTMGEGFGVPIIEAQSCGTPVIVGGWTAMPELLGAGWVVTECERMLTPMGAYQYMPSVAGVLDAYESAYRARGDNSLREQARAFALGYDADVVTETYWAPALQAMADRLKSPATLPPVEVTA